MIRRRLSDAERFPRATKLRRQQGPRGGTCRVEAATYSEFSCEFGATPSAVSCGIMRASRSVDHRPRSLLQELLADLDAATGKLVVDHSPVVAVRLPEIPQRGRPGTR